MCRQVYNLSFSPQTHHSSSPLRNLIAVPSANYRNVSQRLLSFPSMNLAQINLIMSSVTRLSMVVTTPSANTSRPCPLALLTVWKVTAYSADGICTIRVVSVY